MHIEMMYKYRLDNIIKISGTLPDEAELIERMQILYPEEGYELERISDGERMADIWLRDGDVSSNYKEVEIKDDGLD